MLAGLSILIAEDEELVALDLAYTVKDLGGLVIGPAATVGEALMLLETHHAAAAILDGCLLDRDVTPLARQLADHGVPFVIHTGSGLPAELAASHPSLPVVMKPVSPMVVMRALLRQIGSSNAPSHPVPMAPLAYEATSRAPSRWR